jgi:WD40 repeat protein
VQAGPRRWRPTADSGFRSRLERYVRFVVAAVCVGGSIARAGNAPRPRSLPAPARAATPRPAVAFDADGQGLAVGGYGEVILLDPDGARSTVSLKAPSLASVTSVAFDPRGRWLAAAGGEPGKSGEIRLWDLRTRAPRVLTGIHTDVVYSLAWSPDGSQLAACSYDRMVSLWDVASGQGRRLKDHTDAVYSVAFSPDGQRVASASGDRTIKVWDVGSGRRLYTLGDATAELYSLAFSPTGAQIAAGGVDRSLRVWNVTPTSGALARSAFAHDGAILRVLYSPDGSEIYTSAEDRTIKRWDAEMLVEKGGFEKQPDWPLGLALDREGKRLAVSRYDGSVALYDAQSGARLGPLAPAAKRGASR